jgi:hypothetical protein
MHILFLFLLNRIKLELRPLHFCGAFGGLIKQLKLPKYLCDFNSLNWAPWLARSTTHDPILITISVHIIPPASTTWILCSNGYGYYVYHNTYENEKNCNNLFHFVCLLHLPPPQQGPAYAIPSDDQRMAAGNG